ncbi:hypothetical protein HHK36_001226 [Tetracentron sinense]|uniref:Membrane-associated kinase regulator 2 n=1 Tax=Tetracentron sinense TaxID=13715 RepID=A0A834ZWX6_TETSI|nr:hypothetical protein HHK36_001226 [Tetracentron sinense]
MEALSLFKYWRGSGGGANERATTISTTVRHQEVETTEDDDDGPFFDLEFAVPDDDDGEDDGNNCRDEEEEEDEEYEKLSARTDSARNLKFTVSSGSSGGRTDPNLSLSPDDDLFFKETLIPLESSAENPSEPYSKPQFPVTSLKSAAKFRVMLGLKKPKSEQIETNGASAAAQQQQQQQESKFSSVKVKVEEIPIFSLFNRENSSRSSGNKPQQQNSEEAASEDKRFSKDVVQRYLKMIKPLYFRVSRRYGQKLRFSGQLSLGSDKAAPATTTAPISSPSKTTTTAKNEEEAEETEAPGSNVRSQKQANFPVGLRVACKHLGKSRSASSAVAAVPFQENRRDDSLLQQQDGIQSAILHCKRSFNASRGIDLTSLAESFVSIFKD